MDPIGRRPKVREIKLGVELEWTLRVLLQVVCWILLFIGTIHIGVFYIVNLYCDIMASCTPPPETIALKYAVFVAAGLFAVTVVHGKQMFGELPFDREATRPRPDHEHE